jgi:hypothetical protein
MCPCLAFQPASNQSLAFPASAVLFALLMRNARVFFDILEFLTAFVCRVDGIFARYADVANFHEFLSLSRMWPSSATRTVLC